VSASLHGATVCAGVRVRLDRPARLPLPLLLLLLPLILTVLTSPIFVGAAGAQSLVQPGLEDLEKSATAAREAGKIEEALRDYRSAVQIRPDWEEGWWYLGTLEYDADHCPEAVPAFTKVVQLDSANGPAWNFLGLCEFETRDYAQSLAHLQQGQELGTGDDPEVARVSKYHLALLRTRNGEFEKASALLTSAFGDQSPAQAKAALGLVLLRAPLLPQEVDPSKDALVQAAGETASILARGDSARTLDSFRALLAKYPDIPYLHYAFGTALASAARDDEALLQQQKELKISPGSALPRIEISALELRSHHPQAALRAAETAVQLAPNAPAAHRVLGQSLQALGQKEKAAAELGAAQALAPEKGVRDAHIIRLYAHDLGAHDLGAVVPETGRAANPAKSPSFDELSRQAAASLAAGNTDEAIHIYQDALQLHPEWDEGRWNLAMLAYSAGRYPEAIVALKACVARKPDYGTAWAVLGLSEFEIKDYGNALIHLQRGQDLGLGGSKESVELARYRLGVLLNRDRKFDLAAELLAPEARSGPLAEKIQFALGMALLRMSVLPDEVEASKRSLVLSAGEIAALLEDSRYDEVFPKFQALLREHPGVPFLHYAYGTALEALSQYDDAESQLRQEILISPESELPYARMASIALKMHRPADALPSAQRAVELGPDSAEAHYLLGRSCLEAGQREKALQELETASKMAPGSPEVHFNLAKAYAKANLPEKAEQERATFARLNALAELERSRHGSQSYSGSHDKTDFSVPRAESTAEPAPETH
jgi:tetratricopeptide (TPR) repeat protein